MFGKLSQLPNRPYPKAGYVSLEVGLAFEQVEGVNHLNESQQNKLKAHINQLWLERTPSTEIITIASGLVSSMQGLAMREIIVDNFAGGGGASTGIEMALGRSVDIAINHDENAVVCTVPIIRIPCTTAKASSMFLWRSNQRQTCWPDLVLPRLSPLFQSERS